MIVAGVWTCPQCEQVQVGVGGSALRFFRCAATARHYNDRFARSSLFSAPLRGHNFTAMSSEWKCDVSVPWGFDPTGEHAAICGAACLGCIECGGPAGCCAHAPCCIRCG